MTGARTDAGAETGVGAGVARGGRAGTWASKNARKGTRNARSFWRVDTQALLGTTIPPSMNISCTMKLLPTMQSFVRAMSYNRTILRPCPRSSGDRASASGAESHRFESCRGHHITPPRVKTVLRHRHVRKRGTRHMFERERTAHDSTWQNTGRNALENITRRIITTRHVFKSACFMRERFLLFVTFRLSIRHNNWPNKHSSSAYTLSTYAHKKAPHAFRHAALVALMM